MIHDIAAVMLLVLLSGLSVLTGAELEQQVKAARRWAARKVSFPARVVGASARRTPPRVESAAAAGSAPGADGARLSAAAPGAARTALAGPPEVRACCLTTSRERHTRECDEEAAAPAATPAYADELAGVTAWGQPVDVYARFGAVLGEEGIDISGPAPVQRRAPRHALTEPRIDRIDLGRPVVPVRTPDRPPWETETAAQAVLDDAAIATLEAARASTGGQPRIAELTA